MSREKLSSKEIETLLQGLDGWTLAEGGLAINRTFKFAGFAQAFGFMAESALVAERLNRHPEWSNVYSRVKVCLTTHDSQGVTERDFLLAEAMQKAAAGRSN